MILCSSEHSETVEAAALELADTASYYIKSVTFDSCVRSAVDGAHIVLIHDNDVQVNNLLFFFSVSVA